jgi:methyl-accepting chemotaxis protein
MARPDVEAIPAPNPAPDPAFVRRSFFRRRFLIEARQARLVAVISLVTLLLLVLLNLAFYQAKAQRAQAPLDPGPDRVTYLRASDRVQIGLVVAGSVVFLVGFVLVTLLETHKTTGAIFNLSRRLRMLGEGEIGVRLRLRSDDHLKPVERAFNESMESLERRLTEDIETFERLASEAEQVTGADGALALADRLSGEAAKRRSRWRS